MAEAGAVLLEIGGVAALERAHRLRKSEAKKRDGLARGRGKRGGHEQHAGDEAGRNQATIVVHGKSPVPTPELGYASLGQRGKSARFAFTARTRACYSTG